MNHPFEQLADLMNGTLDERGLAGVQAHLDLCATCRQDLDVATRGARAARSLPIEDPPSDLYRRVVGAGGGRGTPAWYRWAPLREWAPGPSLRAFLLLHPFLLLLRS